MVGVSKVLVQQLALLDGLWYVAQAEAQLGAEDVLGLAIKELVAVLPALLLPQLLVQLNVELSYLLTPRCKALLHLLHVLVKVTA